MPAARQRSRSPCMALPVIAMRRGRAGSFVDHWSQIRRAASSPSISGIWTSRKMIVLLTRLGNSLSNYMILLVQEIDIANLGDIYHLDPSGGSRDAENPEEPS